MSIQRAIHERWAADNVLTELVPADRIYTGRVPASDSHGKPIKLPAIGLELVGDAEFARTSSGTRLRYSAFTFGIRVAQAARGRSGSGQEEGERIADAIIDQFNRADWVHSGGYIQDMKPQGIRHEEHEQGGWTVFCDWMIRSEELA